MENGVDRIALVEYSEPIESFTGTWWLDQNPDLMPKGSPPGIPEGGYWTTLIDGTMAYGLSGRFYDRQGNLITTMRAVEPVSFDAYGGTAPHIKPPADSFNGHGGAVAQLMPVVEDPVVLQVYKTPAFVPEPEEPKKVLSGVAIAIGLFILALVIKEKKR